MNDSLLGPEVPAFLFVTCQVGAEKAVKAEMARRWPEFRFAYSRPGFLTFKLPAGPELAEDFDLESVFARGYGFSRGKAVGESPREWTQWIAQSAHNYQRLHVWPRDAHAPGQHAFQPGLSPESLAAEAAILAGANAGGSAGQPQLATGVSRPGERVLDVILIAPDTWWVGFHRHGSGHLPWPGGLGAYELPSHAVSRAYVKLREALDWSGLPVEQGQSCAELGSSPGGASQALLEMGLAVVGIDPAQMEAVVLADPNFTHLRMRSHEVRRREFRKVRWLLADMNVAPQFTLDAVEGIVTHRETDIRGLLLTLKLLDWKLADEIPNYLARIRDWGFADVRARQLSQHRQEFAVAALRQRRYRRKTF